MVALAAAWPTFAAAQNSITGNGLTVRGVAFAGNHALDYYTLSISIATSQSAWSRRYWWIRWLGLGERREFDELEFRRDVLRLQLLYRLSGYYEARVDTAVTRGRGFVTVKFLIEEGRPIVVDSITIRRNDSVVTPRRVLDRLPLKVGKPLNRILFDLSADTIAALVRERGYPFAAVFRNYTVDRATRLAQVSYDVETGPHASIGDIVVDSAAGVRPSLVRRFLTMRVGDRYKASALYQSQRVLYQTDMFRYVAVGLAPDSFVNGVDSLVRIRVTAVEGPRARARVGVGYGTIDCFRTQASSTVANFMGGGRRLDLTGKISKIGVGTPAAFGLDHTLLCKALEPDPFSDTLNYTASATLTQPALFTHHTTGALTAFAERRSEFRAYENISIGGAAAFSFGNGIPAGATLIYRIAQSRTLADVATFCTSFDRCDVSAVSVLARSKRTASLGLDLTDIHTDAALDPTRGHALTLDARAAARALYSQVVFSKIVGEAAWYHPLTRRSVLALRLRAGAIHTGVSLLQGDTIRFVPPEERFYAGGPTTVRGYGRNAMGPVVYVAPDSAHVTLDGAGNVTACGSCRTSPLGSSGIVLGNIELRTPSPLWPSRLRWAFFVDAGQLWEQRQGLVPSGLRITPGMGLRFGTPLGPMRFDVGYNPKGPQCGAVYAVGDSTLTRMGASEFCPTLRPGVLHHLQYHFSVGQAF